MSHLLAAWLRVSACQLVCAFQQFSYGRRLAVYIVLVPAQLKVVLPVYIDSIRVGEGYISHSV